MAPIKMQAAVIPSSELAGAKENVIGDTALAEDLELAIEKALDDYGKVTYQQDVLEDVSDEFVARLAKDAVSAKRDLRNMMRKSPCWDEELQAWVINGNRTHNPDYNRCRDYGARCLYPALHLSVRGVLGDEMYNKMTAGELDKAYDELGDYVDTVNNALNWFCCPNASEDYKQDCLKALQTLAPDAYHEGRKVSKIFRMLCQALGVADERAGSDFQKYFAKFADEISSRQIGFKLFVSINPAHFITMSNPKNDKRGNTLTSCHSFNSTEYQWNCGCTGYARDKTTMVAFTVEDPSDSASLNNRKTSRQIYAYEVGNGILLQSRMYNTGGGTSGAQEETKVYRDLIEREIAFCEGFDNLWTVKSSSATTSYVKAGRGFGGYQDWTYDYYDPHICIQKDFEREDSWEPIEVGTYGLCVECATEIVANMYCPDDDDNLEDDYEYCEYCQEYYPPDEMADTWNHDVYDRNGHRIDSICESCLERHFTLCEDCDNYYEDGGESAVVYVDSLDRYICLECLENGDYSTCDDCGDTYPEDDLTLAYDEDGCEREVCPNCLANNYMQCPDCEEWIPNWVPLETCPCCGVVLGEETEMEELEEAV